ncbi:MAG TPA: hypothetical protein VIE46_00105 [Gemmatimonadales bacterium]
MRALLARLRRANSGQGAVEYALLIALIAIGLVFALRVYRNSIGNSYNTTACTMNNARTQPRYGVSGSAPANCVSANGGNGGNNNNNGNNNNGNGNGNNGNGNGNNGNGNGNNGNGNGNGGNRGNNDNGFNFGGFGGFGGDD